MNVLPLTVLGLIAVFVVNGSAAEPTVVKLWPGKAPGETTEIGPERLLEPKPNQLAVKRLTDVSTPTLTIHRPEKSKDTGTAVVIAPGGGYNILAWEHEGEEVAAYLNKLGVTGILLKYRVPRRPGDGKSEPLGAKQDAQRAISMVRSKSKESGIDPKKVGMLGFSAGGHLTAWTSTNGDRRSYEALDDVDKSSCRPDFTILVYPAYLVSGDGLAEAIRVSKDSPPAFLVHAGNDAVKAENSLAYYSALRKAGVTGELHIFPTGGHGFGMRPSAHPISEWPDRMAAWMRNQGYVPSK